MKIDHFLATPEHKARAAQNDIDFKRTEIKRDTNRAVYALLTDDLGSLLR